jgi:hypothetical protein
MIPNDKYIEIAINIKVSKSAFIIDDTKKIIIRMKDTIDVIIPKLRINFIGSILKDVIPSHAVLNSLLSGYFVLPAVLGNLL